MERLADPYRDLDVIDSRAPRFNQATIGTLSVLAVATGWWWLLAVLAAQLWIGLSIGRRFCIACLVYFELVQPVVARLARPAVVRAPPAGDACGGRRVRSV